MSDDEIARFLEDGRTAIFCTLRSTGEIHAVAMWYAMDAGSMVFTTKAKSQKAENLRRDPRITVLVETGQTYNELRGVEIVGRVELIEEPAAVLRISTALAERYGSATSTGDTANKSRNRVGIRVRADKIVSWDHTKIAGLVAN